MKAAAIAFAAAWAFAGPALGQGAASSLAADEPAVHTVVIDGLAFSPDTLRVKRGDTVV